MLKGSRFPIFFRIKLIQVIRMSQTNKEMIQFMDELYNSIPLDQLLSELIEIMNIKDVMNIVKSKIGSDELVKYVQ